jgi:hypothetical protein
MKDPWNTFGYTPRWMGPTAGPDAVETSKIPAPTVNRIPTVQPFSQQRNQIHSSYWLFAITDITSENYCSDPIKNSLVQVTDRIEAPSY